MKKFMCGYYRFMTNIGLKYMLLKIWQQILLLPIWCLFMLLINILTLTILVIYYLPRYKSKAYEQMVMDSIHNTFNSFEYTRKETN